MIAGGTIAPASDVNENLYQLTQSQDYQLLPISNINSYNQNQDMLQQETYYGFPYTQDQEQDYSDYAKIALPNDQAIPKFAEETGTSKRKKGTKKKMKGTKKKKTATKKKHPCC